MSSDRHDKNRAFQICVIQSALPETQVPKDRILDELRRHHFREDAIFGIKLALEEALTNAVKHGNRGDPGKRVTVRYFVSDEEAVISIRDEGQGFVPAEVPDCTAPDRLPVPNGRGIMLMRAYMDEVSYCDDGREVVFIKKRDSEKTPEPDDASPSPQRRTLYFSGRVQGVGFRYAAQQIAEGLPVTGYVRNLPDGRVELVVEGAFGDLERLQAEVERAMRGCIHQVDACGSPATGEFKGFSISR